MVLDNNQRLVQIVNNLAAEDSLRGLVRLSKAHVRSCSQVILVRTSSIVTLCAITWAWRSSASMSS